MKMTRKAEFHCLLEVSSENYCMLVAAFMLSDMICGGP